MSLAPFDFHSSSGRNTHAPVLSFLFPTLRGMRLTHKTFPEPSLRRPSTLPLLERCLMETSSSNLHLSSPTQTPSLRAEAKFYSPPLVGAQ